MNGHDAANHLMARIDEMGRALYSALEQLNSEVGAIAYVKAREDVDITDLRILEYQDGTRAYYVTEGVDGDD